MRFDTVTWCSTRGWLAVLLLLSIAPPALGRDDPAHGFKALVFSKTSGFRHDSIPDGVAAVRDLGLQHDFDVDATEDAGAFTDANLAQYQVVVFLNTTGDVLSDDQQAAFERYIQGGGGYVGVHAAADTEYGWPWYGGLVGAYFQSHPNIQTATIEVADGAHPSTAPLPKRWVRTDEWYNFQRNPRGDVHVLATLDEGTYAGGEDGFDHPIAWCHTYDGGRAWYTAGGHTEAAYAEPLFRQHLLGGIEFAAGAQDGDCSATREDGFEVTILDADAENPMEVAPAPDGRVFYVERAGTVKVYDPTAAQTFVAGRLNVSTSFEDGLLGIALDPDFASNGWLYLFYSPAGSEPKQHVSRFTVTGNALDPGSEKVLLEIPVQREQCCHSGGSLAFGPDGSLFISTGDNTNPFESDGFAPIDERPGRAPWDAQKSSANPADLRGKILRILPRPDGSYIVPPGNLFPADGSAGRPEIYVMGARNPFRIAVDAATGWLYWGDVGPDARSAQAGRGPAGLDEWNQARAAGNFGWPYCIGPNRAYRDYDFATGQPGPDFDCDAPVNDSPNNTGAPALPPAQEAWIWYPYGASAAFPEITSGDGRTAMAGPVYHFDPAHPSRSKLPAYYDGTLFIYEWSRNWIKEVKLDDDGQVLKINSFLPGLTLHRPMDLEVGPDGALYLLEWGSGFGGNNDDARLLRIDYRSGTRAPVARAQADPASGPVPLTVQFSSAGTFDPDPGDVLAYAWSFRGDGTVDATEPDPSFTYTEPGAYTAQLTVTDPDGNQATANVLITAGNTAPIVTLEAPVEGGFVDWGRDVRFRVGASDAEDGSTDAGTIDCSDVVFQPLVGHDSHSHPLDAYAGCEGVFRTPEGHDSDADNVFLVVEARYTDRGSNALTGRALHVLQPKRKQAEHFTTNNGVQLEETGDVQGGGLNIGFVEHGDYVSYAPMNLQNVGFVTYRVASAGPGGRIEVHVDAPDGELISTALVEPTGAWQTYRDVTTTITDPGGTHELFFVFLRNPGDGGLFNVNWMDFHGDGVAEAPTGPPNGLLATYYDDLDFTGPAVRRVDPMVNFNWGAGSPDPSLGSETFSARWTGQVAPPQNGRYTFIARATDGVRFWLDEELLIDSWTDQAVTEHQSRALSLEAGRRYDLKMEVYQNQGEAQAHLLWSRSLFPPEAIPSSHLYADSTAATGVTASPEVPGRLTLLPAYPNPFRQTTRLTYTLPGPGKAQLAVYDALGRRVATLVDAFRQAGTHTVFFDAGALASGIYTCRLTTSTGTATRRVVVLK